MKKRYKVQGARFRVQGSGFKKERDKFSLLSFPCAHLLIYEFANSVVPSSVLPCHRGRFWDLTSHLLLYSKYSIMCFVIVFCWLWSYFIFFICVFPNKDFICVIAIWFNWYILSEADNLLWIKTALILSKLLSTTNCSMVATSLIFP